MTTLRIKSPFFLAALIALTLTLASSSFAQSTTDGAIGGSITDTSNAVIQHATISVRNEGTGATESATTGTNGRYILIHLQPGVYDVEVNSAGFSPVKQTAVTVEVGRVTPVDVTLSVGGTAQTVTVTGEAPVVNTEQQDFSTNLNQVSIENLPINGRRWFNFALMTPGATADSSGYGDVSFRGISALLNNNTVDGGDNNQAFFSEEKGRTRIAYSTSQESIQEFQINTSTYSAEYGRAAGAVVNAVTKSGTNQIHGALFYFNRDNTIGGAFTPFSTGPALVNGAYVTVPIKPLDIRQQFGGDVGGFIIKDKLFYYFNYDQQIRHFPATAIPSNPLALLGPLSTSETATLTSRLGPGTPANLSAAQLNQYVNQVLGVFAADSGVVPRTGDQKLFFPKLDWRPTQSNTVTLSYNKLRWESPYGVQTNSVVSRGLDSFGNDYVRDDTAVARWTTIISPTVTNEARFQYGRDFEFEFSNPAVAGVPVAATGLSPDINFTGASTFDMGAPYYTPRFDYPDERRTQIADTATWSHGQHLLKFGIDYNHVNDLSKALSTYYGEYYYNNRVDYISDYISSQIPAVSTATRGLACGTTASPLPCYNEFQQGFGPLAFQFSTNEYGVFVQDEWRTGPRLTVNMGLRYEYQQLPSPQIPNPLAPGTTSFPSDPFNIAPRVGFAWDVTGKGKFVIRGGYGIYYGRIINGTIFNALALTGSPNGQEEPTIFPSTNGNIGPLYPNILSSLAGSLAKSNILWFPSDLRNPMIHEYDVVLERQISANTVVSLSWLGSLGHFLPISVDTNLPVPSTITYTINGGPLSGNAVTVPFFKGARPNPNFNQMNMVDSRISSLYNAAVLQFNRRLTRGLQIQASYTWADSVDDGQVSTATPSANYPLDAYDLPLDRGPTNFDIRHRFVGGLVWKPEYFDHSSTAVRWLLSGWTVAPAFTAQSGLPYTGAVTGNPPSGLGAAASGVLGGQSSTNRVPFLERNSFRYPSINDVDVRIARAFRIHERAQMQFIAEAFNLGNHVNYTSAITTAYTVGGTAAAPALNYAPSFGTLTGANNNTVAMPRQIQLGARFSF